MQHLDTSCQEAQELRKLSQTSLLPCARNTRSRYHLSTASLWALTECRETSGPCESKVEAWQRSELTDVTAKVVIYEAFVEGGLEAPKHPCPQRA